MSLFMVRYFHFQNLLEVFAKYFLTNKKIHNYDIRTSSLLHKNYTRTNYAKHTLANKGTDVWNNLPTHFYDIKSYDTLKKNNEKILPAFKHKCMKYVVLHNWLYFAFYACLSTKLSKMYKICQQTL